MRNVRVQERAEEGRGAKEGTVGPFPRPADIDQRPGSRPRVFPGSSFNRKRTGSKTTQFGYREQAMLSAGIAEEFEGPAVGLEGPSDAALRLRNRGEHLLEIRVATQLAPTGLHHARATL